MIVSLLILFVVGILVGLLGQGMLNHWDADHTRTGTSKTTHHHRM